MLIWNVIRGLPGGRPAASWPAGSPDCTAAGARHQRLKMTPGAYRSDARTEAEWLAGTDPRSLLVALERKTGGRKPRLYACALARSLWPYLGDERSRAVVEVAERYADGAATESELIRARQAAVLAARGPASRLAAWAGDRHPWQAARMVVVAAQHALAESTREVWTRPLAECSQKLIPCVFGNLFRSVACDPSWHTSTAVALARAIYAERAFDRLPILADALEDAGCDAADLLAHCRGEGPHVRGCWVVDLLLGKE